MVIKKISIMYELVFGSNQQDDVQEECTVAVAIFQIQL
jgi:hypothetical protein